MINKNLTILTLSIIFMTLLGCSKSIDKRAVSPETKHKECIDSFYSEEVSLVDYDDYDCSTEARVVYVEDDDIINRRHHGGKRNRSAEERINVSEGLSSLFRDGDKNDTRGDIRDGDKNGTRGDIKGNIRGDIKTDDFFVIYYLPDSYGLSNNEAYSIKELVTRALSQKRGLRIIYYSFAKARRRKTDNKELMNKRIGFLKKFIGKNIEIQVKKEKIAQNTFSRHYRWFEQGKIRIEMR